MLNAAAAAPAAQIFPFTRPDQRINQLTMYTHNDNSNVRLKNGLRIIIKIDLEWNYLFTNDA